MIDHFEVYKEEMQAVYEFAEKYKSVKSKPLAITVPS
jgi:hypothetical protein